jgi:hypothetical protein
MYSTLKSDKDLEPATSSPFISVHPHTHMPHKNNKVFKKVDIETEKTESSNISTYLPEGE